MLDPETIPPSPAAFLAYFIEGAEDFNSGDGSADDLALQAIDEKTLEVVLEHPTGFFLDLLTNPSFFPINHQVAEEDPGWHAEADTFIANGPFRLDSWEHDSEMMLAKNEEYWDQDAVQLDRIHFAMVNDENTQYQMFESGELDTASIPPELSEELIDGEDVYIGDSGGLEFYRFNLSEEPFQNEKIRNAFALAIQRDAIAEYVIKNGVEPAYGFFTHVFTSHTSTEFSDENEDLDKFEREEAERLLEEGMEEEGYEELPEIVLSFNTSDSNQAVAEALQDMFSEHLGVDVTLDNLEWEVFAEANEDLELQFFCSSVINDFNDTL